jgi:hypothetical protein
LWINPGRYIILACLDLGKEGTDILIVERESTGQESKENDATGPYISGGSAVFVAMDDLRTGVVRAPAACFKLKGGRCKSCHAPVCDLD